MSVIELLEKAIALLRPLETNATVPSREEEDSFVAIVRACSEIAMLRGDLIEERCFTAIAYPQIMRGVRSWRGLGVRLVRYLSDTIENPMDRQPRHQFSLLHSFQVGSLPSTALLREVADNGLSESFTPAPAFQLSHSSTVRKAIYKCEKSHLEAVRRIMLGQAYDKFKGNLTDFFETYQLDAAEWETIRKWLGRS